MQKKVSLAVIVMSLIAAVTVWKFMGTREDETERPANTAQNVVKPIIKYGLDISSFIVKEHTIKRNELFPDILGKYNVAYSTINMLVDGSREIFNLRKLQAGKSCTVLCENTDSGLVAKKLVYEENPVDYVVFNLEDSAYIYRAQNKVVRQTREMSGVINGSLYETLEANDINPALAVRMADIFAWSVDFYKIQKGDKFKVIYDEDVVDGVSTGIGEIRAIVFNNGGRDNYAFYYKKDKNGAGDYYDEEGNSMKKMFLKSPVKFSRISSRFNLKRFHPVTKSVKAHLGTDYAAPYGTPILATADGVVEDAKFKVYNGNYVKIRHNGQYKTQYLHMSKIAKGLRPGARVKQGDVIGYVGSTGLATGPHVCYRFWKDGQQVDPFKQKQMFAEPLAAQYKGDYMAKLKKTRATLDGIDYEKSNIAVQKQEKIDKAEAEQAAVKGAKDLAKRIF